ncbi:MAG: cytochrome c oxidase subunit II [Ktedonobacteraceae bacterium]|nr:cytochrome c oxidase subunit II [Ktedonobacteraceae bacterium]
MRKPLFNGKTRWQVVVAGLLLGSFLLTACGENSPSILNTFGPVAASESFLFYVILIIATIIFVLVEGALIFSIIRYRERPGMPNPRQIHGNLRIEVLWTVIPSIILFIVLFFTIQGLVNVATQPTSSNTLEVRAVGHQWWWEFYYPKYNITTADELHAPVNTIVQVDLYSNNVIHSFWVPALTGKTDVIPGHNNMRWFKADATGTFLGECAEYCGAQHAHMAFHAVIQSSDDFNTWVSTQQQAAVTPSFALAAQGKQIFMGQCTGCHGIVGDNLKGYDDPQVKCNDPAIACLVGPNLTHFGARGLIAGGILTNNRDQCSPGADLLRRCHLAQWLKDPQGIKPGNDMVVNLTDDQIQALVAYLESLN